MNRWDSSLLSGSSAIGVKFDGAKPSAGIFRYFEERFTLARTRIYATVGPWREERGTDVLGFFNW